MGWNTSSSERPSPCPRCPPEPSKGSENGASSQDCGERRAPATCSCEGLSAPGASSPGLSLWLFREPRPGWSLAHGASPGMIRVIGDQGPRRAARPATLTSEHVVPELLGLEVLQPVQVLLAVVEVVLEGPVAVVAEVTLPHGDPRWGLPLPAGQGAGSERGGHATNPPGVQRGTPGAFFSS